MPYENIERSQNESTVKDFVDSLNRREMLNHDEHIAIVVAHPDDESVAFGAQIHLFPHCQIIHVTDGGPENPNEWKQLGSRNEYIEQRQREVANALNIAEHNGERLNLGSQDGKAAFDIVRHAIHLADFFSKHKTKIVLTHAYEGGHPDHDATAFAVHAAKKILQSRGIHLTIIEAPLYRVEGNRSVRQTFVEYRERETFELVLTDQDIERKRKLFSAHESQKSILDTMSTEKEWLREAPHYNFHELPNGGNLSHLFDDLDIPRNTFLKLLDDASRALELNKRNR